MKKVILFSLFLLYLTSCSKDETSSTIPETTIPIVDDTEETDIDINDWPETIDGWTVFEPSDDSILIYVSNSQGNDDNDGLSEDNPVKTITKGMSLLRDGYPDHLLLKRGDQWTDEHLGRFYSGRSATEPMLVSSYGEGNKRPVIRVNEDFVNHDGRVRSNIAFIGLSIIAYKMDPNDPEFNPTTGIHHMRFVGGGDNILIEDCRLRFIEIVVQNYDGNIYRNVTIRRSMILDTYTSNSSTSNNPRPSGLYTSGGVKNLIIEENVFDHNGWNKNVEGAGANMYNHNIYIQYSNLSEDITLKNNIITRASSHGVHGRPGGIYDNNLLVNNSIGLQMGYKGHPLPSGSFAYATNNVILDGKLMNTSDSSWPRTTAVWGLPLEELGEGDVQVKNNIVAHRKDDGSNLSIGKSDLVKYENNIVYKWHTGSGLENTENPGWKDPERTVATYHNTLGGDASLEGFLEVVRNRPLGAWNESYTAAAVNDYIREGFTVN